MKFCKDCKHYQFPERCNRVNKVAVSPITGKTESYLHKWPWAKLQREDGLFFSLLGGTCGKHARFWEAK